MIASLRLGRPLEAARVRHRQRLLVPSAIVTSSPRPTGSPLSSGATIAVTLSPALIMFDRQPTRCIMLMLVSSMLKCFVVPSGCGTSTSRNACGFVH